MTEEFVVFNAAGAEIDSVDPYMEHATDGEGILWVSNFAHTYRLEIPEGGWWEIREMSNHA